MGCHVITIYNFLYWPSQKKSMGKLAGKVLSYCCLPKDFPLPSIHSFAGLQNTAEMKLGLREGNSCTELEKHRPGIIFYAQRGAPCPLLAGSYFILSAQQSMRSFMITTGRARIAIVKQKGYDHNL